MSGLLEEDLHGQKLVSDNEVKDTVHMWHQSQAKTFFTDGV
jgi:hypothetical protein